MVASRAALPDLGGRRHGLAQVATGPPQRVAAHAVRPRPGPRAAAAAPWPGPSSHQCGRLGLVLALACGGAARKAEFFLFLFQICICGIDLGIIDSVVIEIDFVNE